MTTAQSEGSFRKDPLQKFYRLVVILLSIGALYLLWPFISAVVVLVVSAFLFSNLLLPIVDWLEGRLRKRAISVLLTMLGITAGIVIFFARVGISLSKEALNIYKQFDKDEWFSIVDKMRVSIVDGLPEFLREMLVNNSKFAGSSERLIDYINTTLQKLTQFTSAVGSILLFVTMLFVFTFILLYEYYYFKRSIVSFIPNKYFEVGLRLIYNIEKQVSSYLHGQLLVAMIVGGMSIGGLWCLNIFLDANLTLIVFIGMIAGLANLIPLVGPFVGMVPAVILAVLNNYNNELALNHYLFNVIPLSSPFFIFDIILMFLFVQQIDNTFVTPRFIGKSVGMHPFWVIMALLVGSNLMGMVGMLVAVPIVGTLKVVLKECHWVVRNAHLL